MNVIWWIQLVSYSLALLGILSVFVSMIFSMLDDIRDRWRQYKRGKQIDAYIRSQEQLNKLYKPVDDARQREKSERRSNPELLVLSFLFGLLLGVLFQSIVA